MEALLIGKYPEGAGTSYDTGPVRHIDKNLYYGGKVS